LMACVDQKAASIAAELEVEQLDLMPILERSLAAYYDGFHATPAGARVAADAIASAIQRTPAENKAFPCVDLLAS
jgi:lysophospholipase L1-like esterase